MVPIPNKVEDFSDETRIKIYNSVGLVVAKNNVQFSDIYVVGSRCFNVNNPRDLDIIVIVPQSFRKIVPETGEGYDIVNLFAHIAWEMMDELDCKIGLFALNKLHYGTEISNIGIELPSYNLSNGKLKGKEPRIKIPCHFHFDWRLKEWITFDRSKSNKITMTI